MQSLLNSIKSMLLILVVVCVAGFGLLFFQGQRALHGLEHAAEQMGDGKDIVADILPPPLYMIETHLVAYQLLEAPPSERQALAERFKQLKQDYATRNRYWDEKRSDIEPAAIESLLGAQKTNGEAYWQHLEQSFLPAILAGRDDEARREFGRLVALYNAHRAGVDTTVKLAGAWADERLAAVGATSRGTLWIFSIVALLSTMVAVAIYVVVARRVGSLLGAEPEHLRNEMVRLAGGDLRPSSHPVVGGSVFESIRIAQERIRGLVEQTAQQSGTVDAQVSEVQGALADMERNAQELADAAMATSAAMEQISASISMILDQVTNAEDAVSAAGGDVVRGDRAREKILASVDRIGQASQRAQSSVSALGENSQQVTGIVQTIRSIAEQTNLLALNAAIEAARAGEQGRGFAVVADEVRKLAERTTQATAEIAAVIGAMQERIGNAVESINASAGDIEAGRDSAADAGAALSSIHERIGTTVAAVADIATATREVDTATRQIAGNMSKVSALADSGNDTARKTADAGRVLGEVSVSLRQALASFQY